MSNFSNIYTTFLVLLLFLGISGCKNHCGHDASSFWKNFKTFTQKIKSETKNINHRNWDEHDKIYQKFYITCYPKYVVQLSPEKRDSFWMLGLGYVYSRYQMDLIKKFKETDYTLTILRDSLHARNIDIFDSIDSLSKDWPAIEKLDAKSRDQLDRYLRKEKQDTLLPPYSTNVK